MSDSPTEPDEAAAVVTIAKAFAQSLGEMQAKSADTLPAFLARKAYLCVAVDGVELRYFAAPAGPEPPKGAAGYL